MGTVSRLAARFVAPKSIPAFSLYGEPLQPPDAQTIHVETIAARSQIHAWMIRPHRHRDLTQLLLLQGGNVSASLDGRSSFVAAPCLIVVPPGCVHSFSFKPHTMGLVVSFSNELTHEFSLEDPANVLARPGALALSHSDMNTRELRRLSAMLLDEFARVALGRELALRGLLSVLIAHVLRTLTSFGPDTGTATLRERDIVVSFRDLVEIRYREHISVAAYARALGLSEAALRRACLAAAGESPTSILHRRLAVEAARQLRYTSMTIAQVAEYLGFGDPAYFTRFFKREMRVSPSDYREPAPKTNSA